ncbi:MAG TPA: phosphoglucosamine mutase [Actinomycetota bacterium]|nr:phosphoglucosamine mutase [Actinomycetota bacterium]
MARLFGTDGIRGVANRDLTPDLALAVGRAAGSILQEGRARPAVVVVGRDTRLSGPMLESALVAGLCSAGTDVLRGGILPTAAVAYLTVEERCAGGAVISASHNPVADNGIKFFSADGRKAGRETEAAIEARATISVDELPMSEGIGSVEDFHGGADRYVDHLLAALETPLRGLRVVLDCAFGAAFNVGPRAFREAGAEMTAIHAEPDGSRINVDCGATSLGKLARAVVEEGADVGFAFDGDADRVLAVDERGEEVDGDRLIGMTARHLRSLDALHGDVVVTTVMSNLGFRRALEESGIEVVAAPVGDRFVAEAMAEVGASLGGEQSGHVIFAEHATTGDGILTALQIAAILEEADEPLSKLAHFYEPFPQVLLNVPVSSTSALDTAEEVWAAVRAAEESLGTDGRVLVRASGTEPLVRVMVEASDGRVAEETSERLAEVVRANLA